ncbi:diguanylate cyclase (GGDEF)-like protein/PAS domain S-box-containing protein [Methylohalomonas lacus]|uniref:Diguanylate cyclase (GGDEF)-like protein/PAS domain S-box-containing protein n=1 Tax=Methylohalomonas lacus TaxID=398773 RepID=A0AAE3HM78_9GAMM|nr:EAL domain-containing protein [Methylohalomonas lacus]MCS3903547.1 diguanylate cyclase (GGDEF)-like protein/PAS domain S-box-containing protein [Methylohalomonas lacus]
MSEGSKNLQQAVGLLAEALSQMDDAACFDRLIANLAQILGASHVLLAQIEADRARTLTVWSHGRRRSDFDYALAGTPCANVCANNVCHYPTAVQQWFPDDSLLRELGIEAYCGAPVFAVDGQVLGFIAVMHEAPLALLPTDESILTIAAAIAGTILARQHVERAMQAKDQQLANLLRNLPGMAYRCRNDELWTTLFVSEAVTELAGYVPDDLIDNRRLAFVDIIHPDDRQYVAEDIAAQLAEGDSFQVTYRIVTATGDVRWVWEQGRRVSGMDGDNDYLDGYIANITPVIEAQQERDRLLELEQNARAEAEAARHQFQQLFESAPGLYLVLKPDDYRIVGVSNAYLEATYTEREAIVGRTLFEVFPDPPDEMDTNGVSNISASLERVRANRVADAMAVQRYPVRRNDGGFEDHYWSPLNSPVLNVDGSLAYIIHRIEDVTEFVRLKQRRGEWPDSSAVVTDPTSLSEADIVQRSRDLQILNEELRASELRFQYTARAVSDVIWDWDIMADVHWWSDEAQNLFGYSDSDMNNGVVSWEQRVHPEDRKRVLGSFHEVVQGASDFWQAEYRFQRLDGSFAYVSDRGYVIRDNQNRPVRMVGGITDLSERKDHERRLVAANRALTLISRCNAAIIDAVDEQQLLQAICQLAVDIGGYAIAWVGYAQDDAEKSVAIQASAGETNGFLTNIRLSWSAEVDIGRGGVGQCLRTGEPAFYPDISNEPAYEPWRELAQTYNVQSVLVLPLKDETRTFGVLVLNHSQAVAITAEERELLRELAANLAFGIGSLRDRFNQQRILAAISKTAMAVSAHGSQTYFKQLVGNMVDALGARAGFIARFEGRDMERAMIIAAFADGEFLDNFEHTTTGTPCENYHEQGECVIDQGLAERYPQVALIERYQAQAHVGRRLDDSAGNPLGILFLLYSEPLDASGFVISALRIFAVSAAAELEREKNYAQIISQAVLLENTRDTIVMTDLDDRIISWNKGAEQTYGWRAEEAIGCAYDELLQINPALYDQAKRELDRDGYWKGELEKTNKAGEKLIIESRWTLSSESGDGLSAILHIGTDITQRKRDEAHINQLAFYDALTGLPNRSLFMDRLKQTLAAAQRQGQTVAVMFLDLSRFKEINDTQGHDIGDLVLIEVGRRLQDNLREGETLARLGGDEFIVIAVDVDHNRAALIAERLQRTVRAPLRVAGETFGLSVSIGIAFYPQDASTPEELLKQTDIAMYRAKHSGSDHCFYRSEMSEELGQRLDLARRFSKALDNGDLELYYQPQVDLLGDTVIGMEALLRWQDETLGWISPDQFIPLAEERGMMNEVGQWVLTQACRQLVDWHAQGLVLPGRLAINIAAQQIGDPDFIVDTERIIQAAGLQPSQFELELTETGIMIDPEQAIRITRSLKEMGFILAIDDFGTGYSSLAYLKQFAADILKIDISFVRDMLNSSNDRAIVTTIIAMASSLDMKTLAEGVETAEQRLALAKLGCDHAQGYYFGAPVPAGEFSRLWLAPATDAAGKGY